MRSAREEVRPLDAGVDAGHFILIGKCVDGTRSCDTNYIILVVYNSGNENDNF